MENTNSDRDNRNLDQLQVENASLRARLEEAEETLRAIRHGEVDAVLVSGPDGSQVFTLQSAEQPYRILIEQMQEGAVTLSMDGAVLYCNMRFAQMLKIPHEKMLASPVQALIAPEHAEKFRELLGAGLTHSARGEITLCTGESDRLPTYITVSPLPAEVEGSICMVVTDLTEQESMRRNQETIEALNTRLHRAMTETHHRVKNSLQIMTALVDMHIMENHASVPAVAMRDLNLQIHALATVHDILTQQSKKDPECHEVSAQPLLNELLSMLKMIAGPRELCYSIEDATLTNRQPVALALVANELVLNALKHGLGVVSVSFRTSETDAILEVSDDGAGIPDDFDCERVASTGMDLTSNLVTWDLQGSILYSNRVNPPGTLVTVTFPLTTA